MQSAGNVDFVVPVVSKESEVCLLRFADLALAFVKLSQHLRCTVIGDLVGRRTQHRAYTDADT